MSLALKKAQREKQDLFDRWHACIDTMRHILHQRKSELPMDVWFPMQARIDEFEASNVGKEPK